MAPGGGRGYDAGMRGNVTRIVFAVEETPGGGYLARALGHGIFTEADTLDELHDKVSDAVRCHFEEPDRREVICLHFPREEVPPNTGTSLRGDPFVCFDEWSSDADTSGYAAVGLPPTRD
jgi:hypothetical protein